MSLQDEVEALVKKVDLEKINEIAIKKKRLQDVDNLLDNIRREKDELEAKEKRANNIILMNEREEKEIVQAPTSNSEGENVSSATQDPDLLSQVEEYTSRNNLS